MLALLLSALFVVDLEFSDGSAVRCLDPVSIEIQPDARRLAVSGCQADPEPGPVLFADSFEEVSP